MACELLKAESLGPRVRAEVRQSCSYCWSCGCDEAADDLGCSWLRRLISAWWQTGDARLVPPAARPVAAIFSCFGLQQMPAPADVFAGWVASLAPGGVAVGEICTLPSLYALCSYRHLASLDDLRPANAGAVCFWPTAQTDDAYNSLFGSFSDSSKAKQADLWDVLMVQQVQLICS